MGLKKVSKKVTPMFTATDYETMASEYAEISSQIKTLEDRKKALSEKLKSGAESLGVKDDKGSYYLDSDTFVVGKVASKSVKIDQVVAVEALKKKGLTECVKTVTTETVDEGKLEQAVAKKDITLDEVEKFTTVTTSYKVSVKAKEEVPVVEQSKLSVAKKK